MGSRLTTALLGLLPAPLLLAGCKAAPAAQPQPSSATALAAVAADPGAPRAELARRVDALFSSPQMGETRALIVMHDGRIVAERYGVTRESQDRFAAASQQRAAAATAEGRLSAEIAPLTSVKVLRDKEGNVSIPKRGDGAKHHGARKGLAIGLAGGLVVALFPAVALGGALLVGGGAGAGIGAIAGHISNKASAEDLKTISETLHAGSAGIVIVADPADADEVQRELTHATGVTRKEIAVDDEKLDEEVQDAAE